ncbi:MAG TPA: APC family permease, partial [Pyrinomonadaceae bacterium]|nr:APC family permease [Pyrinomonadaceae bacterium]
RLMNQPPNPPQPVSRLRRDLGTVESYAALIGILIGAGIFKVTSDAGGITGPSVILSYIILMPAILATSIPYAAFISTPLGREPGGEYLHISRTLGGFGLAYVGSWLKIIAYVGAAAYLADALASYVIELTGRRFSGDLFHQSLAIGSLLFFYLVHVIGVRWFGRIQVAMCVVLGFSIIVLVVPGLFAIHRANYSPFFTHGAGGLALSFIPLFFSYAGFESLAQTAGETKDSTRRLPLVFLRGISLTALIFVLMSVVAFGVLPLSQIQASATPMTQVAMNYLPWGAATLVTLGAVMAITTSLNPTLIVPSRLALIFVEDGLAPPLLGSVNRRTATPVVALTLNLIACLVLLVSRQLALALNIAVFALVLLYFLHSLAFLLLPRFNPELNQQITISMPAWLQRAAAVISVLSMGALILVQISRDVRTLQSTSLSERISAHSLTSVELAIVWSTVGVGLYVLARVMKKRSSIASR